MKRTFLTAVVFLVVSLLACPAAFAQDEGGATAGDQPAAKAEAPADTPTAEAPQQEEKETVQPPEINLKDEAEAPADEYEDEQAGEETVKQPVRAKQPTDRVMLPADEEDAEGEGAAGAAETGNENGDEATSKSTRRKVSIDAVVVVNYAFNGSGDAYSVKYHISLGGDVNADVGIIKGNAKVATDISGYLAKASAFECVLKVSIADVPYEIMFKKVSENEADLTVSFKGQLMEDWESLCTFLDNSGAKFNTRGAPERWIGSALEKAKPSLSKLNAPLDNGKTTTQKFIIQDHMVSDELGSAKIEGTGVVTIENRLAPKAPIKPSLTGSLSKAPTTIANIRQGTH